MAGRKQVESVQWMAQGYTEAMDQPVKSTDTAKLNATNAFRVGCPQPSQEESQLIWARWYQAMELSHAMLMSGLRQKVGSEGDVRAAYRQWYEKYQALKWERKRDS